MKIYPVFRDISYVCGLHVGVLKLHSDKKPIYHSANVRKEFYNRHRHDKERKKIQVESLVNLILTILFVINASMVLFVGYVYNQEQQTFYKERIVKFPVPCEDLSLSADEDLITFDVNNGELRTDIDGDGKYICSKSNVKETVKIVVERQARIRQAKGLAEQYLSCGNESLAEKCGYATVSFTKLSKHQNYSGDGAGEKLRWDQHSDKCHIDPSVHYDNGEVTIPEGRTYFVYASAHFNISRQRNNEIRNFERRQRLSIRICRTVYGYEQTLLGRTELFNMTNTENVVSGLSIGSHLELSRNDTIYVRASRADKIILDSTGNNFGFFPL